MKVGFDMLYSQVATAYHGIGNFSFSHLTYLRMSEDLEPHYFCPKYAELSRADFIREITRFLVDHQIDIFHLPSPMTLPYPDVFFSGELPQVRITATVYDIIPFLFPEVYLANPDTRAQYQLHLDLLRQAHHLFAISENTRRDLINLGIPADKITVISGGCDETYFPYADANTRGLSKLFPVQLPFLLTFDAVDFRKNAERLIRAFAIVAHQRIEPWQLVFVNQTPPHVLQHLTNLASELGVVNRIHHLGRVDKSQLLRIYNQAQAVAIPTLYEGFGLPALEAMQCGTPVLSSNTSSLPEIVADAAVLVNPQDVNSIADGLRKIMSSPTLRAGLRQQGLQRAQSFDWKLVAQRTQLSFRNLMQSVSVPTYQEQGYDLQQLLGNVARGTQTRQQSLELQPNRHYKLRALRNRNLTLTYVSFNLAALPPGSRIQHAALRMPVPNGKRGVRIHRIRRGWDVQSIKRHRPAIWTRPIFLLRPNVRQTSRDVEWECTHVARQWQQHQLLNHGVYIRSAVITKPTLQVTIEVP